MPKRTITMPTVTMSGDSVTTDDDDDTSAVELPAPPAAPSFTFAMLILRSGVAYARRRFNRFDKGA